MNTDSQPQSNAIPTANIPLLPAWTLTRPAAPVRYEEGQVVRFHYWLSNVNNDVYVGVINGFHETKRWGKTALINPTGNAYHLPPRYVSVGRIVEVVTDADELVVPTVTKADVDRLEREWFEAQDAPANFDEAMTDACHNRTYNARTAYLMAASVYRNDPLLMPSAEDIAMLEASKSAPQQAQEAVSSPADDIQASTIETAQEWPEIAPVMTATNETPRVFAPYKPIEQDAQILAAKRQAQYETAKARVEAIKNGAPVPPPPAPAPQSPSTCLGVFVKTRRAMTPAEQASEDGLQAMLGKVGGGA